MNTFLWFAGAVAIGGILLVLLRLWLSRGVFSAGEVKDGPTLPSTRIDKNVQFTVYRPATIVPNKEYTLLAFAHLSKPRADAPQDEPDPVKEVQRLATKILSDQPARYEPAKLDRGFTVPRQGFLLFVPKIEGCSFNPPTQSVQWLNSVQKVEFGMTAAAEVDGRDVEGQMTIYLGTTYLTEIPIRITVDSKFVIPESQQGVLKESSAEPYRKVFVSYSRKDTKIVEDFEAYVRALGDEYLRDVRNIRAGEVWSEKLQELIKGASVFQLFWSSNSMTSEFVKQEWEYALALNREKFIRPVYWEEPRPEKKPDLPPPNLDRLEFYKFPTAFEEDQAAVLPVWKEQGGELATGKDSLSLWLQGTHVKHFVSMIAFATVAAVVFGSYNNFSSQWIPPSCPECPLPTPTDTRGIWPSPLPTPSLQATPVVSPSSSPVPSVTPTPMSSPLPTATPTPMSSPLPTATPTPRPTTTPTPTPTPTPFSSAISVKIDPAVFGIRKSIGTYVVEVNNEGSDTILRVVIRQTLRKDVKYESSDPPAALEDETIVLNAGKIAVKESIRFRVTIRMLGEVKPGEIYVPEQTIVTYLDSQGNRHKYSP